MEPFLRISTNLTAWRSRNHRCFILKSDRSPRELVGQWSALGSKEHIISTDNAKEKAAGSSKGEDGMLKGQEKIPFLQEAGPPFQRESVPDTQPRIPEYRSCHKQYQLTEYKKVLS